VVEAVYRQKLEGDYARYLVATTRTWGEPLRHASFEIRLPPGAKPLEFSYPFARRETEGEVYYCLDVEGFFPDRDIVVRWVR